MGAKGDISDYRRKLDKTLTSQDLKNEETLQALLKNQFLSSSVHLQLGEHFDYLVERRSKEVSSFLDMLRSASVDSVERSKSGEESQGGWKVKQDTEEFRVMYREGPEGTPFHTLLVEGYVDGPVDVCLCISWESSLYKKWWPQTAIPTFKIVSSQCLQRVRTGEQISLVRMKVSWPLSSREVLVHYFVFEYFEEGLVVVLLNSISDSETIHISTHGFTQDGIPDARDVVRIDVVGGFAIQKVTADRSYFRTIANMDIKLDFIPPAFINFISRQLIGSGFKLYKKEVASVTKGDKEFSETLKDPLYARIREALYSENMSIGALEQGLKNETSIMSEEQTEAREDDHMEENIHCNGFDIVDSKSEDVLVRDQKGLCEIEEIEETDIGETESLHENIKKPGNPLINEIRPKFLVDKKNKVVISAEVEQALGTLEKVISIFREYRSNPETGSLPGIISEKFINVENDGAKKSSVSSEADPICRQDGNLTGLSKRGLTEMTLHEPRNSSGSHSSRCRGSKETSHNKIAPASPDEDHSTFETNHIASYSSKNQSTEATVLETNHIAEKRTVKRTNKKSRYCCLTFIPGKSMAE
ncbi:Polyketide cyclase/dehydrase and lipid transport superfamily protein [Forsythia ovata]|uniref:Polyketide cyclase/dehydrase and lipid transport superfamily protein n=1 Tax=Forsythia ovata TaxID=205694 RepID=A0ABD1SU11_9LAMI